ncbi:MAG: hypothetical protein IT374_01340 [Polyangiaceae bacterium]|nr:hypothetical protein [Polyangiaceae bacterium]
MMQATQDPNASAQQFACDACGGTLLYDPGSKSLKCKHCKAVAPPARLVPTTPGPREIPLRAGLAMQAPTGLGVQLQAVQCNSCGATVNMGPEERAGACSFCASPMVVTVAAGANLISPESLVPFQITKDHATSGFNVWLKGLWFRPSDLAKLAKLDKVQGVYVPYWTFDADVRSDWTAERGWNYQETEWYTDSQGNQQSRTVTKTRWEHASGWRQDHYDDVLVCASKGVPAELVDKLTSFQTTHLVAYSPGYLAGWKAEAYVVQLPDAWSQGQKKIFTEQEKKCGSDVGGDTHRALVVQNHTGNETFKHVLLPIYVAAYRYGDKPYQVLINGQTGEVVGKAPWSVLKIALAVLAALAFCAAMAALVMYFQHEPAPKSAPTKAAPAATTPKRK